MPPHRMKLFVFGSSLVSSYWNGAATYYRGIYKYLYRLGYHVTFAEPDIYNRQRHRDLAQDPPYASCRVYRSRNELLQLLREAQGADLIIKHSGVGADDDFLEAAVLEAAEQAPTGFQPMTAFWDVDAPATLSAIEKNPHHPMRALIPQYDFIFTYGGGAPVIEHYLRLDARNCHPVYNAFDPETHHPVPPDERYACDLLFVGHRLPDREARVREYFFGAAESRPSLSFVLAGEGWGNAPLPGNVRYIGHAPTALHNVLNCSARCVLNINRDSMASYGFSPPTRVFEAAGAGACLITDAWQGIEMFFEPGREILVAKSGAAVVDWLDQVDAAAARQIGARMRLRALAHHTYAARAQEVHKLLAGVTMPLQTVA